MKVKLPYDWPKARSSRFNVDTVRRCAVPYRAKRNSCFITKKNDADVAEIKEWLQEAEVSEFVMYGVFTDDHNRVFFEGLVFEFVKEDDLMYFKLRFF